VAISSSIVTITVAATVVLTIDRPLKNDLVSVSGIYEAAQAVSIVNITIEHSPLHTTLNRYPRRSVTPIEEELAND